MRPEQWHKVLDEVSRELQLQVSEHELSLLAAFHKNASRLTIGLSVEIVSEGAHSADVKTSISYVVDRVRDGAKRRILLDQEELPMPQATVDKKHGGRP